MKYCCIRQHDITDCGAACLATIAKQNGYHVSIAKIRELAGTDKLGTNVLGLLQAAEKIGFDARGVKGNRDALSGEVPLPCIAHVIVNGSLFHYVVIQQIKKNYIILSDPAEGVVKLTRKEFFGEYSLKGEQPKYHWTGALIFISENKKIKKNGKTKGLLRRFFSLLIPQKNLLGHI